MNKDEAYVMLLLDFFSGVTPLLDKKIYTHILHMFNYTSFSIILANNIW